MESAAIFVGLCPSILQQICEIKFILIDLSVVEKHKKNKGFVACAL